MRPGTTRNQLKRDKAVRESWMGRLEVWRRELEQCGREPSRRHVHWLRVATLRLQAELEHWRAGAGADDPAAPAVARWMKQARKLRGMLKPAREADVCLGMLAELRKSADARTATGTQLSQACRVQERLLKRRLERRRAAAAKVLEEDLRERQKRLTNLSREMETALGPGMLRQARPSAAEVRAVVIEIAENFPVLSAENLHEFRKRMKAARYLADLGAATDAAMRKQVAWLGELQTAAGAWHDWEMLAQIAGRALRHQDAKDGLSGLLETMVAARLKKALSDCHRITAELRESAGEESTDKEGAAALAKKPVVSAERFAELDSSSAA